MNFITSGTMPADVIFGNPRLGCAGQGICKVTSTRFKASCPCLSVRAWIKNNREEQCLVFCFSKELLPAPIRKVYFDSKFFLVEEEVKVDLHLLELDKEVIQLKKGFYNIMESDDKECLLVSIAYKPCIANPFLHTKREEKNAKDLSGIN